MGERKGTNKYYPPDFDPGKGSLNAYHGTHALRERARKIHEGIIIIRFEMPYNIWCNGCGNHIGMGVRYNAQKRKVGNYYTTPIYKFRMKCHLCDQHFEIQTDPKNCDYVILSGAKRKEERWDPAVTENIQTTDRDVKAKLVSDAMFKLEHSIEDKQKAKRSAPKLNKIREIRDVWEDDFAVNQALRQKFREEKKEIDNQKALDGQFKERNLLPLSMELAEENEEDAKLAKRIRFGEDVRPDIKRKRQKQAIKQSSIFEKELDSKGKLARRLVGVAKKVNSKAGAFKVSQDAFSPSLAIFVGKKGKILKGKTFNENATSDTTVGMTKSLSKSKNEAEGGTNISERLEDDIVNINSRKITGESSKERKLDDEPASLLENLDLPNSDAEYCKGDIKKPLVTGYDSSSDSNDSNENT